MLRHTTPLPLLLIALFTPASVGAEEPIAADDPRVLQFAENVLLHTTLQEMGHALVREFDLPVLGNEETLADAFATYYVVTYLPDRGP
ncbi:MAG: DUF4344 domain-containing metallopeptidase, partial [Planctomycetota bacterium]